MTNAESNPAALKAQLNACYGKRLIDIHKALLDHERARYEKEHGTIQSANEVLNLVINDKEFAWLRVMSGLIVQIDEFISSKEPPKPGEGEALLAAARKLVTSADDGSDFQRGYHRGLQESPEVAHAHGQWRLAMIPFDRKP